MADLIFSDFLFYLAILSISAFVFYYYYLLLGKQKHGPSGGGEALFKLPPGNTGWPIIGENLHFAMANRRGTPETFINDRTSKYDSENAFRASLLGENLVVLCGAPGNKFLFSNEDKYVRSWWPRSMDKLNELGTGRSLTETKQLRISIQEFVKPEALQNYAPIMDSMAKQHLESDWSPHKHVKVFPLVKKFSFALACRLFMNIEDPDLVAKLAQPFETFVAGIISTPINLPGTAFYGAVKARKNVFKEVTAIIRKREEEIRENRVLDDDIRGQDMLTRMLLSTTIHDDNNSLSKEAITEGSIAGLLVASHDTTSSAITSAIYYLAEFPDVYDQVLKEQMEIAKSKLGPDELLNWEDIQKMKYSWMVACEAMRVSPPAAGSFREAVTDFTFSGFTIPKGWKAFWTVHSTHKNPKYFPDPERFDPSRFEGTGPAPYTFVPFGGGPRMCPGREYARLQILVFIHNLVTKFKWRKAIPNEKITYTTSAVPVKGLPVWLEPHDN